MDEVIKWCVTAACTTLSAVTIFLVVNVLSWKPRKRTAPKNEISQPRQYFLCCAFGTILLFALVLLVLFLPEGMVQPEESRVPGALIMSGITMIAFVCAIWFYRWRIVLGKKEFTCYFLLRTRTYRDTEVRCRAFNNHFRVYRGKRYLFSVMYEADNATDLMWRIMKNTPPEARDDQAQED